MDLKSNNLSNVIIKQVAILKYLLLMYKLQILISMKEKYVSRNFTIFDTAVNSSGIFSVILNLALKIGSSQPGKQNLA